MLAAADVVQGDFKEAMRRLASTVAIVSAETGGESYGMTMTAVTSFSMAPPSLVICVNRDASLHAMLARAPAARFCVNLLCHEQAHVATVFAGALPREERFALGDWRRSDDGAPYLADAQCNIFCSVHSSLSVFSHTLFVGIVEAVRTDGAVRPLIYANGAYGRVSAGLEAAGLRA